MTSTEPRHGHQKLRVLVLGPVPPPYSGKNVMIETLVAGCYRDAELVHVNAAVATSMADMGRLSGVKVLRLVVVLAKALWARAVHRPTALYYNPAGDDRAGIYRDLFLLTALRPMFKIVIFHLHGRGLTDTVSQLPAPVRALARRSYQSPDALLGPSRAIVEEAASLGAAISRVVPNGTTGGQPAKHATDEPELAVHILFLNLISEPKGAGWLLEAVADLLADGVDVQLCLAGEVESEGYRRHLRDRAHELGVEDRLRMPGLLRGQAKWDAMAAADIFCVPSTYSQESFGLALIEAASCALPVVAANVPGVRDVLRPEVSVLLADPEDRASLSRLLGRLCRDPQLRQDMGLAARRTFEERYTVQHYWAGVDGVFADLAARPT